MPVVLPCATRVEFDDDSMWLWLTDGRRLGVPLAWFPRLMNAAEHQRLAYEISAGGAGLHWDALDEDISVEFLLIGVGDRTMQHAAAQP